MLISVIATIIFVVVMAAIISEKVHRSTAALAGAMLLIILGVFDIKRGVSYVDFNTIGLLIGMMLFVAIIKRSGMFEYLAVKSAKMAGGDPWRIMVAFVIITAVFSALLDNVTTVLLVGPMTFAITEKLDLDPVPYIMTQIMASNIGGTATLIGDPPNIMIGSATGFTFMDFILNDGSVVVIIMAATVLMFRFMYRKKLVTSRERMDLIMKMDEGSLIKDRRLFRRSVFMIAVITLGFVFHGMLGVDSSMVALAGAIIMFIMDRPDIEEVVCDIEWPTIVFFTCLFIVVGGMVETGVIDRLADIIIDVSSGKPAVTMMIILWVSALLSSTLDNIPFVAAMIPLLQAMGNSGMEVESLWWALSLGACLGGNGTIIGASANVILTGISEKNGHPVSYIKFLKTGMPVMLLSMVIASIYMLIRF